jgi:hypothetical protein
MIVPLVRIAAGEPSIVGNSLHARTSQPEKEAAFARRRSGEEARLTGRRSTPPRQQGSSPG